MSRKRPPSSQRNLQMVAQFKTGQYTLADLATLHGVNTQRVSQILQATEPGVVKATQDRRNERKLATRKQAALERYQARLHAVQTDPKNVRSIELYDQGATFAEIASQVGKTATTTVINRMHRHGVWRPRQHRQYNDEERKAAVRMLYELGTMTYREIAAEVGYANPGCVYMAVKKLGIWRPKALKA